MKIFEFAFESVEISAPTAFKAHGIGLSKRVTSYPSTKDTMIADNQYTYVDTEKVVVDGNVVTSRVSLILID
jgi:putative intracellular protease/amidase